MKATGFCVSSCKYVWKHGSIPVDGQCNGTIITISVHPTSGFWTRETFGTDESHIFLVCLLIKEEKQNNKNKIIFVRFFGGFFAPSTSNRHSGLFPVYFAYKQSKETLNSIEDEYDWWVPKDFPQTHQSLSQTTKYEFNSFDHVLQELMCSTDTRALIFEMRLTRRTFCKIGSVTSNKFVLRKNYRNLKQNHYNAFQSSVITNSRFCYITPLNGGLH